VIWVEGRDERNRKTRVDYLELPVGGENEVMPVVVDYTYRKWGSWRVCCSRLGQSSVYEEAEGLDPTVEAPGVGLVSRTGVVPA
jgi:hypothetical protein